MNEENQLQGGGIDLPDLPEIVDQGEQIVKDENRTAVKMAFIGSGQAGNRIADYFYKLGYRRVVLVNTTRQDVVKTSVPESQIYTLDILGGAGKDPEKGRKAIESAKEEIFELLKDTFGEGIEQVIVCAGGGGGTGGGSAMTLIELAKQYLREIGVKDYGKRVGAILTLPKRSEGSIVQQNAAEIAEKFCRMATAPIEQRTLTPLLLVDNERIKRMFSNLSILSYWPTVNATICKLFDIFNIISESKSDITTFDAQDYRTMLSSGIITCGMTKLTKMMTPNDLTTAIRGNVTKNVFVEGMDIKTATHVAGILAADETTLSTLPTSYIDAAFESMIRIIGDRKKLMVHQGVYTTKKEGIYLYTLVGGMKTPQDRLNEIFDLGGEVK